MAVTSDGTSGSSRSTKDPVGGVYRVPWSSKDGGLVEAAPFSKITRASRISTAEIKYSRSGTEAANFPTKEMAKSLSKGRGKLRSLAISVEGSGSCILSLRCGRGPEQDALRCPVALHL